MNLFDIAAKITLDAKDFMSTLGSVSGKVASFGSSVASGIGSAMKVATAAIGAATTAATAFAGAAVKVAAGFDSSMSQVVATMGYTVDELNTDGSEAQKTYQKLSEFAQQMGSTTAFSASEAADALNYMALAGYSAETSMEMLPNVLNLAAAGGIELAAASDMVTDAQSALGLTLEQTSELVDKMAKASSKSNTSVAQLGDAILTVGGTAKNLAGGTTELTMALGLLADNGIKGAEGGTALRNIILSLSAPTDQAAGKMEELGLQVYDAYGNMRPLNDIFLDLNDTLSTMTQGEQTEVLNTLFNKVDLKSANALLATSAERWDSLYDTIENGAEGAAQAMAEVQLDNLEGDITLLKSAFEGLQIAVGSGLTPTLRQFVQFGSSSLSKLTDAFKNGGLKGAMDALGTILSDGLNMIIERLPDFIESGMALLEALGQGIMDNLPTLLEAGIEILTMMIEFITEHLPDFIDAAFQILTALANGLIENLPLIISSFVSILNSIITYIVENLPMFLQAAMQIIMTLVQGIITNLPQIVSATMEILQTLITYLIEHLDEIIQAAFELIAALAQGLIDNLPEIISAAIDLLVALVDGLLDNIDMLIDVALDLILALADGLIEAVPKLIAKAPEIVKKLVDAIIRNAPKILSAAGELILKLLEGLGKGIQELWKIGENLVKGLWDGISGAASWLWEKITGWLGGIWDGICSFFGIHSPSKKFAEMGKYMSEGLGIGFVEEMKTVEKDMENAIPTDFSTSVKAITDSVSGGGLGYGSIGEGAITIQVYGAEGQSEEAIAEEVERRLAISLQRRQAVWA